jgi:hypothetical protein
VHVFLVNLLLPLLPPQQLVRVDVLLGLSAKRQMRTPSPNVTQAVCYAYVFFVDFLQFVIACASKA